MPTSDDESEMQSLAQLLRRTINKGAPLYNQGKQQACYELYLEAAELSLQQEMLATSSYGVLIKEAVDKAQRAVDETREYKESAWILRRCFDNILSGSTKDKHLSASTTFVRLNDTTKSEVSDESDDGIGYWQNENVRNTTVEEKAEALADTALILRSSLTLEDNEWNGVIYNDTFPASAAVELLTALGLAADRDMAADKCTLLLRAGLIRAAISSTETPQDTLFKDGTNLYRFPSSTELEAALQLKTTNEDLDDDSQVRKQALQITFDAATSGSNPKEADMSISSTGISTSRLSMRRHSVLSSPEHVEGVALVQFLSSIETHLDISDRRYHLRTYEKCFVGSEAVDAAIRHGLADSRQEAVTRLKAVLSAGLVYHVTQGHGFKDEKLFYRISTATEVKSALDKLIGREEEPTKFQRVQHVALVQRYKQAGATGLNVKEILNSFFGCEDESGWDLVDLQNWRNNMKRWGFGRPTDVDHQMNDKLSPLVANIDPAAWDVAGDDEWESPWGILAQIALFDQVSRSAFRGTPDAFKWDELAKRATRVAIERGYFESAYNSTLNRFLILLPLEHSESWEDQKLGVHLLLQMLSTVAIQDEDLSDYEIVKRLEFSKRLTTAFLEHAQVIAKFKRYPHRNRPLSRTTTIEERVWLASDLVPRWAKSQNRPDDAKKSLISLPVIPLKRLTKR